MNYRVVVQPTAEDDLLSAYRRAADAAPLAAGGWLDRFQAALQTLARNPARCAVAREDRKVAIELREFHVGRYPYVFRVLFTIEEDAVYVLRIRRAQRKALTKKEIQESLRLEE